MKRNRDNIYLALKIIWALFSMLIIYINIEDIFAILEDSSKYPIGIGDVWQYRSVNNYIISSCWEGIWAIIGTLPLMLYKKRYSNYILLIHFVISLINFLCIIFTDTVW